MLAREQRSGRRDGWVSVNIPKDFQSVSLIVQGTDLNITEAFEANCVQLRKRVVTFSICSLLNAPSLPAMGAILYR